jgi:PadR family transcriptional regulator AphA
MFIMSLKHAILGFLSWRPLTGYELKKLVAESEFLHWSGNSNQIYTTLVRLHLDGLATVETQQQENLPPRKTYTLAASGRDQLRRWVLSAPDLPEARSSFLVQLAWADQLGASELDGLIGEYERAVELQLAMSRERIRRGHGSPDRTAREAYLWKMAHENRLRAFETELKWARDLRRGLGRPENAGKKGATR